MSTVLVTVVGPSGRRDLSLPADAPIYELMPTLVDLTGGGSNGAIEPGAWTLSQGAGVPLASGSTLGASGVLDGTVLYLAPAKAKPKGSAVPPPPPVSDGKTPAQRTAEALPAKQGLFTRMGRAFEALFMFSSAADAQGRVEADPALDPASAPAVDPATLATPTPSSLTLHRSGSPFQRARRAWRSTNYLEQLDEAIVAPRLRRCATIAVVSPKGGVGKTTTTALLGMLFALLRRDRIVAVDTNPDYGSLGRVLAPRQRIFVDDLLDRIDQPGLTLTALDSQLGRAAHGLMVLPAPTDPARMEKLDEDAYDRVIARLQEFVGVVMLDCGTGLQEPSARAAIKNSDQLVLVTDAEPAAASLVAEAATMLARTGRPLTLVVNKMPSGGSRLDLDRLGHYVPQAQALVVIPHEPDAAGRLVTSEFTWRDAPESWQRSCRELAVTLVRDWPRIGLTL